MPINKKSLRSYNPEDYKRRKIPTALKEQVWLQNIGQVYECECTISWCKNYITVFDYHVGHDIPLSKGGTYDISNLRPICSRCNLSMGDRYTIKTWERIAK